MKIKGTSGLARSGKDTLCNLISRYLSEKNIESQRIALADKLKDDLKDFLLEKFNINYIFDRILALLPEGPGFYAKDQLTDKPEKFFVSEIIREKILMNYKKEIPYSVEVIIESFKEEENIVKIRAEILVIRDSQKGIIIGHQGKVLKKVGTEARKDMELFLEKKVFLELFVKVNKDWRDSDNELKRFGYSN